METNPIMTAAVELFASYNAQGFRCRGGEVALDAPEWKKYEDFREAAELFNEKAGKEVMHVGLLKQLNGEDTWKVFNLDCDEPDALDYPEIAIGFSTPDAYVVGFDGLDTEESNHMGDADMMLEYEDDFDEDDARDYREAVAAEFAKIRKEMTEDSVLVWHSDIGSLEEAWEVCDRHPTAWTENTTHYRIALIFENDLYE